MFKLLRLLILCICSFCFAITGCESTNNDNIYIEERETINCDQVKQDFLSYVNENIENVLSIVDRELKERKAMRKLQHREFWMALSLFHFQTSGKSMKIF